MLDIQKRRVQLLLFVAGVLALSMTAEKCRELVGKEAASKSGQFTFMNCFDMGSGSLACAGKEGVKLYVNNLRSAHIETVRQRALEKALADALTEGLSPAEAAKQAQKIGAKATKVAARQAKRILGPIISCGWDFFEAMYFGGSMTEGFLRGMGTLFGTYAGGFHGEERLGKLGYLVGSQLGSWGGGRIGLMVYDVINGLNYMLEFVRPEEYRSSSYAAEEGSEYADNYRSSSYVSEEGSEYADNYRSREGYEPTYSETPEEAQAEEDSGGFSLF
ncbi:uncharacterized protein LOC125551906 [Triticum urartu]|uniref:uncharacterized protein LOC125551900 n=1 Tax=Triticum urartu TaxID=4572 RepID=UPI00204376A0|nr:uncharacterized protein LOC125551900 [Triticum urartu]XP_048571260.1 uncharacterized protein LOC125551906 [Triticum urartu]